MAPALDVAFWWLAFGGLHIGLAVDPVRRRLVAWLGERGFFSVYSAAATVSFALLVRCYAAHRFEGSSGFALGAVPAVRWLLMGVICCAIVLIQGALASYPRSASALFRHTVPEPGGLERVSRHPFFVGVALLAIAHVLLATRLVGTVFSAGLALLALLGSWHQDRKLLRLRGTPYARYLATTSLLPFAAILAGRQRLVLAELPWRALASGIVLALVLRAIHASIFAYDGMALVAVVAGGGGLASYRSWQRARRTERGPIQVAGTPRAAGV